MWCFKLVEVVVKKSVCEEKKKAKEERKKTSDSCCTRKGEVGVSGQLKRRLKQTTIGKVPILSMGRISNNTNRTYVFFHPL